MKTHLSPEECLEALGDKVINALSTSVAQTRRDLARYRLDMSGWVADSSGRGLANWIHDRLWANLVNEVDHISDVVVHDDPPIRELFVARDLNFRVRVKRHDTIGRVANYPTQGVFDFFEQNHNVGRLPGFEETKLVAGYTWEAETHDIGPPVISYRDGMNNLIWIRELDEPKSTGDILPRPSISTPPPPEILIGPGLDDTRDRTTPEATA